MKWLYVVSIALRKKQVFEAQVDKDGKNIEAPNASQENKDGVHEINNNDEDEDEEQQSSKNSYDDEDIDLEIEYGNLMGMDIDIGIDTLKDIIEDEFYEEELPQINDHEL